MYKKISISVFLIVLFVAFIATRPVFAQNIVGEILGAFKEKAGFVVSLDSPQFIFDRQTPNYRAYAGDQASLGGHRIRLERDGFTIDLSFLSAEYKSGEKEPEVLVTLTTEEEFVLDQAEQLLVEKESTQSGMTAISQQDRLLLEKAKEILYLYGKTATKSAEVDKSDTNLEDFLLLVALKSFKIHRLALDVDLKLADLSRDVSTIMSQAKLIEEEHARKVTFSDPNLGIDMDYRLNEGGIVQEIIIKSKDNLHDVFRYRLDSSLAYKNIGNGVWYFDNMFRIPKSWARDSVGSLMNDVDIAIEKSKNDGEIFVVRIPHSWLTDAARVFPVTIYTAIELVPELRDGKYTTAQVEITPTLTPTILDASPSGIVISPTEIPATPSASPSSMLIQDEFKEATQSSEEL